MQSNILAKYDAMLFPTYWHGEGFPGIIIDAFVSGLPVIATDWSLNADIIEDGKTGVILKENTVEALAEAMDAMINNPKFVEDVLRDVVINLRENPIISEFEVECEALESIHNHSAWAYQKEVK